MNVRLALLFFLLGTNDSSSFLVSERLKSRHCVGVSSLPTDPASLSDSESTNIRRELLKSSAGLIALSPLWSTIEPAIAAQDVQQSVVSPQQTVLRLRKVPTFCIVDGNGIPFMTYDKETAAANAFFFLEYENALAVLSDAQKAYKESLERGEEVVESWATSRVVTLPLDYAMRLSIKQTMNKALNAGARDFRTIIQVLPTAPALDSALSIDGGARFRQRGRVPLFTAPGLELTTKDGRKLTPAYFEAQQLKAEWKKQGLSGSPNVKVRELSETFRAMTIPGGTDESVRDLIFIPSQSGIARSLELRKQQGDGEVYKSGEMILTK